ncbi:MAG TPA: DUF1816 domain-containing protein [Candidatus Sericytochromatia bacterium]|jgi:hypothetical protein
MKRTTWKNPETEEFFTDYLQKMGIAWWVEIITETPKCIYYFGPFVSSYEAESSSSSYIKDLEQEAAEIIAVDIKRGQPRKLTIFEDEFEETIEGQLQAVMPSFADAWLG